MVLLIIDSNTLYHSGMTIANETQAAIEKNQLERCTLNRPVSKSHGSPLDYNIFVLTVAVELFLFFFECFFTANSIISLNSDFKINIHASVTRGLLFRLPNYF